MLAFGTSAQSPDEYGVAGPRCCKHGANRRMCNGLLKWGMVWGKGQAKGEMEEVLGPLTHAVGKGMRKWEGAETAQTPSSFEPNAPFCGNFAVGKNIQNRDNFEIAGARCKRHGVDAPPGWMGFCAGC